MQRTNKNFSKLYVGRIFQIKKYRDIYCEQDSDPKYFYTSYEKLGETVTIIDENAKWVKCLTKLGVVWFKRSYLLREVTNDNESIYYDNPTIVDEAIQTITNAIHSMKVTNDSRFHNDVKQLEKLLPLLRKIKK